MSTTLNIEFSPITRPRNYAPERTFVTKWDVEIENTRAKKIARWRDRDTKYFDYCEDVEILAESLPVKQDETDCAWELESDSDDGDGEETHQGWLRSIKAENAYYDHMYEQFEWYDMNEAELDTDQGPVKRIIDIGSEQSAFKRVRA
jgi:hypothetical protein